MTAGVAAYQQRNFTGALIEFQASANRDDVRALNYLGIMYADGMGTPRDDTKAVAMFSKAALLGFPEAMANMGRMHAEGRGVPQDNKAAIAAFSAAARSGFQPAITRMAMIYERGELGVAPDAQQARDWRARLSAPPGQSAPAAAVPGANDAVAATPPAEPVETSDMVALARAARAQLQVAQEPRADKAPPQAAAPVIEAIAPVAVAPAAVTPPESIQKPQTQAVDTAPLQAPVPAQNVIESIAVTLQAGEILIRVRTKTPLAAVPADFVVVTPPRIVFDFPQTITSLGRYNEVGEGDLQSVDVISGDSRTRMVLILRNGMQHFTSIDGGDLLIRLKSIAPATSSSTGNTPWRSGR